MGTRLGGPAEPNPRRRQGILRNATLVDERTSVSYRDAMEAALKLNEIARKDEGAIDRARMLAVMGRIIEVVRTFIPSERWPDVQAALRGEAPVSSRHRRRVKGCAHTVSKGS